MQAARVREKRERPEPGAASSKVRWPRGMRSGQSQVRGLLEMWAREMVVGEVDTVVEVMGANPFCLVRRGDVDEETTVERTRCDVS